GPLAIVEDGDEIVIDAETVRIDVTLSADEIAARMARWQPPAPRYTRGLLAKFAKTVASASEGAVTDKYL
ncbi:MAG TPA: dihydroxy-acid dehydratase, partial [Halieaceae bacterium]|nr:dihydroxy-acid dehydratase [Halieaceae bacterium]